MPPEMSLHILPADYTTEGFGFSMGLVSVPSRCPEYHMASQMSLDNLHISKYSLSFLKWELKHLA